MCVCDIDGISVLLHCGKDDCAGCFLPNCVIVMIHGHDREHNTIIHDLRDIINLFSGLLDKTVL